MQILGATMLIAGALLALVAAVGLIRLSTVLSRLHAAAKPASLGLALVAVGAGIAGESWALVGVGLLVAVLQFLTAPVASHLLGRSVSTFEPSEIVGGETPQPAGGKRWWLIVEVAIVWVVLWRDLSFGNVASGATLGLVLTMVAPRRTGPSYTQPLAAGASLLRYVATLVRANARMAHLVLAVPGSRLEETIVVCDLETRTEAVAFFDANATSFAPGTLTLEISSNLPYRMLVHAIGQSEDEVRAEVAEIEASTAKAYE
jgi:monovalent cation/proton antiporter MnhG/PhaG subunit